MCVKPPETKKPQEFQSAKAPVYRDSQATGPKTGRSGTVLTKSAPVDDYAPTGKKTLLGG